ncbi:YlbL family protein [Flexivirga oryzae]|uniref:endopeptidase La n=1 Tax=Flexivirga oryzae TaxID=1794944 RepID=A0A839NF05_9MICO|nr:S16 family serine protease [Flexivirga oryzae]MBB2890022.1 PDZ domain-containing protein [Flexivirga oryzae]MBB2894514.1 PDZ domain-containing protein [Flexivirga oryzae]
MAAGTNERGRLDGATGGGSESSGSVGAKKREAPRSLSRSNIALLITALVLVVAVAALNLIHVPKVILRPGPVTNTLGETDGKPVVEIKGVKTYPTSGNLDFVTISMAGGPQYPVSVMEWLKAKYIDNDAEIDPESMWFPKGITSKQVEQQSTSEMTNSQETAEVVAMRAAGITVPESITVVQLQQGAAAAGELKPKDVLVSLNGSKVTDLKSVSTTMSKVTPGATVPVVVKRAGKQVRLRVPTGKGEDGGAVFGIAISPSYKFPYDVKVNVGAVGGPSAGTMFTLAMYDMLTPGALTGGKKVAGTGTISEDGSVGPIGGIRQKLIAAKRADAQFFFAPGSDCQEAKGHVPSGLTVIRINTLQDALKALKQIRGGKTTGFVGCG